MKEFYYLINNYNPIISTDIDDIEIIKSIYNTDCVIRLYKKQYEEILSYYIIYITKICNILNNKKKGI